LLIDLWDDTGKVEGLMQMRMQATDILEQLKGDRLPQAAERAR